MRLRIVSRACRRLLALPLLLAAVSPLVLAGELSELLSRAEENDPNYQAILAAAEAVRSERNVTRAGLLPEVSFQARAGGNSQNIDVAPGAFGIDGRQSFDSEFYEANARQPILHWDRWLSLKQSDERVAQVEADVAAYYASMVMSIAERYFNVLGARSDLITSTAELRALEAQYEQVKTRHELGSATEAEVVEAQADVDRAAAELVRAQSAIAIGEDSLSEIVGGEVSINSRINDDIELGAPSPSDIGHWTALAAERNPQVLSALALVDVADYDRRIARAGHLPTMDLVGRYGLDSQGGRFGNTDITSRSIGVEVEVPIFQGGAVYNRHKAAGYRATQAKSRAAAAARSAKREASEAYRRIHMSLAREKASQRALSSSIAALGAIESQYESGFRTIADVIEAQKNVFAAQRNFAEARRHIVADTLKLKYASGELALDDFAAVEALLIDDHVSIESSSRKLLSALSLSPAANAGHESSMPELAPRNTHEADDGGGDTAEVAPPAQTEVAGGNRQAQVNAPQRASHGPASKHGGWLINASSFRARADADALAHTLSEAGYTAIVSAIEIDGTWWHRVRINGFGARREADEAAAVIGTLVGRENLWVTNN